MLLVQVDVRSKARSLVYVVGKSSQVRRARIYNPSAFRSREHLLESTVTLGREPDAMVMWGMPEAPITSATTFDPPSVDALAVGVSSTVTPGATY